MTEKQLEERLAAASLGRKVRGVWVQWASEQPDPKPSWLVPWEDLDEGQREVDERIGVALYTVGYRRAIRDAGIVVIPWGEVEQGDRVLDGGEWATVRDHWLFEETCVGLLLWVDGVGDRQPNPYHTDKHVESLTAVRRAEPSRPPRGSVEAAARDLGRALDVAAEVMLSAVRTADAHGPEEGMAVIREYVWQSGIGDEMAPQDAQEAAEEPDGVSRE